VIRILITPLFGIGDAILTTPALKILKENSPDSCITFFTFNSAIYEIFKTNPHIDNLLYYPLTKKNKIISFFYILKHFSFRFDTVINFYPSNRKDYNIFSFFTFSPKRIGHRYNHFDLKELNWLKNFTVKEDNKLHCVEENIKLLEFLNIKIPRRDIPQTEIFLTDSEMKKAKDFLKSLTCNNSFIKEKKIGIHTGSSSFKNHVHRRWPKEYFLEVVNYFDNKLFFLFGTEEEKKENLFIQKNCKYSNVIIVENKPIREVASIIKNLDMFISNDSGLMHVAAAVGTPVIAIFGPTNPVWVRPWCKKFKVIGAKLKCSPCFYYSPEPLTCKNTKKWECLKKIKPEFLIDEIKEML